MTNRWEAIKSPQEDGVVVDVSLHGDHVSVIQVSFAADSKALVSEREAIAVQALDHWNQNPKRVFHLDQQSWQSGEVDGVNAHRTTVCTRFLESIALTIETGQSLSAEKQHNLMRLVLHTLVFQSKMQILPGQIETAVTGIQVALEGETPIVFNAYRQQAEEPFGVKTVRFTEVEL